MTRAEIVQLEMRILTALNYECAATQADFDRWAQLYSGYSTRPGSTSLHAAIVLIAQAIRRLQTCMVRVLCNASLSFSLPPLSMLESMELPSKT